MEKKIILLGLSLIFFGMFVKGIDISGTCDSLSVQCDLQINEIEIFNDSGETQTFYPSTSGQAGEWVSVLPESLTLSPGETGIFEVYTIAPCYAEPGNYSAEILIDDTQSEKLFCNIEIEQGHFVDVTMTPSNKTVTQCKDAVYTIELENNTTVPNQQKESVHLSVTGIPNAWLTLESKELIVEKDKKQRQELTIQPPCDAQIGSYDFEVKASLFNQDFYSIASGNFSIENGQEIIVRAKDSEFSGFQKPFVACNDEKFFYSLEFENNGRLDDKINLSIPDKPGWVLLSETSFELKSNEKKEITLIFEKTDAEGKIYDFELIVVSEKFVVEEKIPFSVSMQDCYNLVVEKTFGEQNVCDEETQTFKFNLKNDRQKTLDLKASIEGLTAAIIPAEFSLGPNETKELEVLLDITGEGSEGVIQEQLANVELILDLSKSMELSIEGEKKLNIAKNAIYSFIDNVKEINLGLRVFGQGEKCENSRLIVGVTEINVGRIQSSIRGLQTSGDTPLTNTLSEASNDFVRGKDNYIILVSDGKESCNDVMSQAINSLIEKEIKVYAIGFNINEEGKEQLEQIATSTFGQYFDASNSEELNNVFEDITKKFEIILPKPLEKTFTLKLDSANFSFEKDYFISISDCYNAILEVPDLSLCKEVLTENSFTISNLGTKEQTFVIQINPDWIKSDLSLILSPGESATMPLKINPQKDSTETELTIIANSDHTNIFDTSTINFLDNQTCYAFGLEVEREFEGKVGEGERKKITIENLGQTIMNIFVQADQSWVYFEPEEVTINKGQTSFVNFYLTPPFDFLGQTKEILLTAINEFGFIQEKMLTVKVTGPSFGLIPANVSISPKTTQSQQKNGEKEILIEFELKNESEQPIEIYSIEASAFKAFFEIESSNIESGNSTKIKMTPENAATLEPGIVRTELTILTNEGIFKRALIFEILKSDLEPVEIIPGPETNQPEEPLTDEGTEESPAEETLTGLFSLANIKTGIVILLLFVVIGLLGYYSLNSALSKKTEKKKEPKKTTKKVPAKKKEVKKKTKKKK